MRSGSTLENRQLTLLHSNNCIDTISPSKACSRMCHRLNWQHCGAWNKKLENALHFKLHKRPIRAENTNEMLQWLLHWWIFDGFLFFVFFCMFCSSAGCFRRSWMTTRSLFQKQVLAGQLLACCRCCAMWKDVKSGVKLTPVEPWVSVVAYGLMVDTALRLHGFISRKFLLDSWQRIAKQQRSEKADAETKRKHQAACTTRGMRFWFKFEILGDARQRLEKKENDTLDFCTKRWSELQHLVNFFMSS